MSIKTIGVIGSGQMGLGIAQAFATTGFNVLLNDINPNAIEKGLANIEKSLFKFHDKGIISEDVESIVKRISASHSLSDMQQAELVIEAVIEDEALKSSIFNQLDQICSPETLLATNTSSISITRIATHTQHPERVIGMHFMNPVPLMKLVEVTSSLHTSTHTLDTIKSLIEQLDKVAIVSKDRPGFVVNRVLIPMINEAITLLDENVASAEDIDQAMQLGAAHPMGPLTLADMIGLDTCLSIMNVLYEGFKDSKYRPSPLLQEMVDSNRLGRKTSKGFFDYST